jgi:biotin carboxyl carrier protein
MVEEGVTAPIPGTILSVKVKVGASVKPGDVLLTIEAMKMENDIVAPRKGVVKEIRVSEGQTVKYGDVLAVIE